MPTVTVKILEPAAMRQLEKDAGKAISAARVRLLTRVDPNSIFFARLAMFLDPVVTWDRGTMATDGKRLLFNPVFTTGLTPQEVSGVVRHEVLHCAFAHFMREGSRNHQRWNIAADLAINQIVLKAGFTLPKCRCMPGEGPFVALAKDLSAEQYYELLDPEQFDGDGEGQDSEGGEGEGDGEGGTGQGQGKPSKAGKPGKGTDTDPGGCGEIIRAGDESQQASTQRDWKIAVNQAANAAKQAGKLSGGVERLVESLLQPRVDWRTVLRDFITNTARNDYNWSRPNRRFMHRGLYLPGLQSEALGDVVVTIDTSGSISEEILSQFAAEAQAILEPYECKATILYHDVAVHREETWEPSDGPLKLTPCGGGGTSHVPVLSRIEELGLTPTCVVALTDCYTEYPTEVPDFPVLWACVGNPNANPPFGRLVAVE